MLTNEERDVVVAAMRKYPAGVSEDRWGKSLEFFDSRDAHVQSLPDDILLEHG